MYLTFYPFSVAILMLQYFGFDPGFHRIDFPIESVQTVRKSMFDDQKKYSLCFVLFIYTPCCYSKAGRSFWGFSADIVLADSHTAFATGTAIHPPVENASDLPPAYWGDLGLLSARWKASFVG